MGFLHPPPTPGRTSVLLVFLSSALASGALALSATRGDAARRPVSFSREVRPILSDRCFVCHGKDDKTRRAKLRLDSFEAETAPREGKPAITPGNPAASALVERVTSADPEFAMPPRDSHRRSLSAD